METMYDRLGELLNETLEAGQVRFVSTAGLRQEDEPPLPDDGSARGEETYSKANPHDAQGSTSAYTAAYDDSVQKGSVHTAAYTHDAHKESTHTASQPHSRMSGGAQEEAAAHAGDHGGSTHTSTGGASTQGRGGGAHGGSSARDGTQQGRAHTSRRQGGGTASTHDATRRHTTGTAQAGFAGGRGGVHGTARHSSKGGAHKADFVPFNEELRGTASTQQGGYGGTARPYTFRQFALPRVATMNEEQMRALRLLDLSPDATLEDVKRAYKEKLKYFHPDKYDKNEVLKTVATKKTRMIVEAYELLCKHFVPQA